MAKLTWLLVFAQVARSAMLAIHTRSLEQPDEHRARFERWCFETQFARVVEAGVLAL